MFGTALNAVEKRMLAVRRETMLVVWYKAINTRNMFEGSVDIREIKERRSAGQVTITAKCIPQTKLKDKPHKSIQGD